MSELELPGGIRLQQPDPTAQQLLQQLVPLLLGIQNQLDLLVKMECGILERKELKRILHEQEARIKAAENGERPK